MHYYSGRTGVKGNTTGKLAFMVPLGIEVNNDGLFWIWLSNNFASAPSSGSRGRAQVCGCRVSEDGEWHFPRLCHLPSLISGHHDFADLRTGWKSDELHSSCIVGERQKHTEMGVHARGKVRLSIPPGCLHTQNIGRGDSRHILDSAYLLKGRETQPPSRFFLAQGLGNERDCCVQTADRHE